MPKKKSKQGQPNVNPDLEGLEISINEFGEIEANYDLSKINKFLNKNVEDKKLQEREDYDELKEGADQHGKRSRSKWGKTEKK